MRATTTAADIVAKGGPFCPECGEPMTHHGGTIGYLHCGWKLLYRSGGWADENGNHVADGRLAGPRQDHGARCVEGIHLR